MTVDRPVRTVFVGSGAFAVPIADAVAAHPSVDLVAAVSAPDRPAGRGHRTRAVPLAGVARDRGWQLLQPPRLRSPDAVASLGELEPGLLVLADYGQIVPQAVLDMPVHGALNVHPSLLPRHRGASPVAATILSGDDETGVTIIRMDLGVDTGPIVAQERTSVLAHETAAAMEARLAVLGARVLSEALAPWLAGLITARPQPEEGASVSPLLRRSDGHIDWSRDAAALERQVRAYQPWPGSFSASTGGQLAVLRAHVVDTAGGDADPRVERDVAPGTVVSWGRGLAVHAGTGLLELDEVQLGGRRRMTGQDLRNGYPRLIGERLA